MKKLILILLIITLLFGCEKKNKIELIPNLDLLYISAKDVKIPPIPIDTLLAEKLNKDVMSFLKNTNEKYTSLKILKLSFRLYIDETGKVDYIKVINNQNNPEPLKQKQDRINLSEEILNEWIKSKEYWNFYPAKLSEKPIKSSIDMHGLFSIIYEKVYEPLSFEKKSNDFTNYFIAVDGMPSPIGGMAAIQKHIVYPEIAKRAGIQGRVFVKAFIDSVGNVAKAEIIRGIGAGCDEAAVEAVKKVKFNPGLHKGKHVGVQVTVPILFKLQ